MQAVHSNILIQKIDNYIKNNNVLVEVEAVDFSQKLKLICDDFYFPLSFLRECSISQKIFSFFSVLVIRDKEDKMIGFKLIIDNDGVYQFASFERKEKDGSLIKVEEYAVSNQELNLFLEVERPSNEQENIFIVKFNHYDNKVSSSSILKETVVTKINQGIENVVGDDGMKIYQIHRKEPAIPKFYHNLNNVISYDDKKYCKIHRK